MHQLLDSLRGLLASALDVGRTRLELFTVEIREEISRAAALLIWTFVALLAGGMGVLLGGLAIIFAFWDTHRILASVLVTGAFLAVAAGAVLKVQAELRARPKLLEATLAELARDQDELTSSRP